MPSKVFIVSVNRGSASMNNVSNSLEKLPHSKAKLAVNDAHHNINKSGASKGYYTHKKEPLHTTTINKLGNSNKTRLKTPEEVAFLEKQFELDPTWSRKTVKLCKRVLNLKGDQIYKWGYDRKLLLEKRGEALPKRESKTHSKSMKKASVACYDNDIIDRIAEEVNKHKDAIPLNSFVRSNTCLPLLINDSPQNNPVKPNLDENVTKTLTVEKLDDDKLICVREGVEPVRKTPEFTQPNHSFCDDSLSVGTESEVIDDFTVIPLQNEGSESSLQDGQYRCDQTQCFDEIKLNSLEDIFPIFEFNDVTGCFDLTTGWRSMVPSTPF